MTAGGWEVQKSSSGPPFPIQNPAALPPLNGGGVTLPFNVVGGAGLILIPWDHALAGSGAVNLVGPDLVITVDQPSLLLIVVNVVIDVTLGPTAEFSLKDIDAGSLPDPQLINTLVTGLGYRLTTSTILALPATSYPLNYQVSNPAGGTSLSVAVSVYVSRLQLGY